MIDQSLKNRLQKLGLHHHVVSMLTQTQVSKDDPAFGDPSKPIGVFYSEEEAKQFVKECHFSAGSMAPKMEAAISFAEQGGKAIICSLEQAVLAMEGKAGTSITR